MEKRENLTCKVCGKPAQYLCETFNEHSKTQLLHHYRCTDCGMVFIGDQIDNEELGIAYSTLDQNAYYEEIKVETGQKFQNSIADITKLVDKDIQIIDVGTGDGGFIKRLVQNGFTNVSGHEIPDSELSDIESLNCKMYYDYDYESVPSNHFDVATLLDVAEHVLDPSYLFKSCSRILKPGGIVYFHTPVVTKTDRMMHFLQKVPVLSKVGKVWQRGRTSVFHQQNYTVKSIEMLMKESDFESLNITVKNELSWGVSRYVRIYLCEKQGLPTFLAPLLAPFFYPFFATNLFNANKAVVWAKKRG